MSTHIGDPFDGFDDEGDIFPDPFTQLATIRNWGGDPESIVNDELVEIVDKRHGYYEVVPIDSILGWGRETVFCLPSELEPRNAFTALLLSSTEDLE